MCPLPLGECADSHCLVSLYTHPTQELSVGNRRYQEPAVIFKGDESAVEEMVDAWGE